GERRERRDMARIREQALLRQLDHIVSIPETAQHLDVEIAEDVLLLPAAAPHLMDLANGRRHPLRGGRVIAAHHGDLALEQICAEGGPEAARPAPARPPTTRHP